jgi:hypothetical protein
MRPKRCHDRFGAMRIAPAVSPFSIKIVRMVGDTAHLFASPSLTLSSEPEGPTILVMKVSQVCNSILRRLHKVHETSTARLQRAVDISVMKEHVKNMKMSWTPRQLAISRPSCEIVGPTIDHMGPASKSKSAAEQPQKLNSSCRRK